MRRSVPLASGVSLHFRGPWSAHRRASVSQGGLRRGPRLVSPVARTRPLRQIESSWRRPDSTRRESNDVWGFATGRSRLPGALLKSRRDSLQSSLVFVREKPSSGSPEGCRFCALNSGGPWQSRETAAPPPPRPQISRIPTVRRPFSRYLYVLLSDMPCGSMFCVSVKGAAAPPVQAARFCQAGNKMPAAVCPFPLTRSFPAVISRPILSEPSTYLGPAARCARGAPGRRTHRGVAAEIGGGAPNRDFVIIIANRDEVVDGIPVRVSQGLYHPVSSFGVKERHWGAPKTTAQSLSAAQPPSNRLRWTVALQPPSATEHRRT